MRDERVCLALILGASRFPRLDVEDKDAFAASADGIAASFERHGLPGVEYRVERRLFDSELSVIDQRREMSELFDANADVTDLFVYYVGHGGFLRKSQEYYLALRSTEEGHQDVTGLRSSSLAEAVSHRFDRTFLVLDACFAGEVVKDFQPVDLPAVVARRTLHSLPSRGVALLLASSKDHAAMSPPELSRTMFCDCLLEVLDEGVGGADRFLTLFDVADTLKTVVRRRFGDAGVMPEIHSPQQTHGDAARAPLFVNPAYAEPEPDRIAALERKVLELEGLLARAGAPAARAAEALEEIAAAEDTPAAAQAADVLERSGQDPRSASGAAADAALALTVRPDRARVPPGTVVTWTCRVANTGAVALRDVALSERDGTALAPPFDLEPEGVRRLEFTRRYADRGGRRAIAATARTDGGDVVTAEASARVRVRHAEAPPAQAPPPEPPPEGLALPRFRRALREVKATAALGDPDVNRLIALIVEGERHYRVAAGVLPAAAGWSSRVADWDREAKSVASRAAFVMVKFQPLTAAEIVETIALVAERIEDATGIRIPTDELA